MVKENKYKPRAATLKTLKALWEKLCKYYVRELHLMWELDCDFTNKGYGYWVGQEIGGVYAYGDVFFMNMDDMRYVVEHQVSFSEYDDWMDYCVWANRFGYTTPNLDSWIKGCPRVSEEERNKIAHERESLSI